MADGKWTENKNGDGKIEVKGTVIKDGKNGRKSEKGRRYTEKWTETENDGGNRSWFRGMT
jgi:hypothetical protein